jgi:phenolic acid decarboxylase
MPQPVISFKTNELNSQYITIELVAYNNKTRTLNIQKSSITEIWVQEYDVNVQILTKGIYEFSFDTTDLAKEFVEVALSRPMWNNR